MSALAHKVALAVVEASKVFKADPTQFYLIGNRKVRLVAAAGLFRSGAVGTSVQAARLCRIRSSKDITPSSLTKIHVFSEMIDPVVAALGGPKAPAVSKPGYQKAEGPKGFARVADPDERKALAAKGGAAVPAEKRAFSVSPALATEAGAKGHAVRFSDPDRSAVPFRPAVLKPVTVDVVAQKIAAIRAEQGFAMRRTEQDRRVPAKIMTRNLMGDPKPGRTPWAINPEDERQAMLERSLRGLYGADRAAAIMAGQDAASEADRRAWQALGR